MLNRLAEIESTNNVYPTGEGQHGLRKKHCDGTERNSKPNCKKN
jgi:hypothetical protein